jgi:hypothetical protein
MTAATDPSENDLLDALPDAVWPRRSPRLESVEVPLGKVACESSDTVRYVFFPTVSLSYLTAEAESTGIAVIGHEGVVGSSLFLDGESTLGAAVVRSVL